MKRFKQFFSESYEDLEEQKMSFQDAEKLKNKHLIAMQNHKKSGNSKGYAAHSMVVSKFEDAYDHHGTGIIPAARILAASQKVFKDYPHSSMKEEVELDEVSKSTLKSYITKKSQQIIDKDKKSNPHDLDGFTGSSKERNKDFDKLNLARKKVNEAKKPKPGHNAAVMAKNISKVLSAIKKEEVELDEDTMPGNVALRLVDRHQAAAFHHKKNGNMKGYAAHFKVANSIEDSVIRAGRDMPIRSKRLEAASDKAFKEHPHRVNN